MNWKPAIIALFAPLALAQSTSVGRSDLLEVNLKYPALSVYNAPVTAKQRLELGNGFAVGLGPQQATVVLVDSHGDDSSGWWSGTSCAKRAEVLVWKDANSSRLLLNAFLNGARRAGWKIPASEMASDEGGIYSMTKGKRRVEAVLRSFERAETFIAVLCDPS